MKNFIISGLLLLCLNFTAFSQSIKEVKPFTLKGKIIGKDSGKIILTYPFQSKRTKDTVLVMNGAFVFKGNIVEPTKADIVGGNDLNFASFYLEPGVMNIILTVDKFKEFRMAGSKTQEEQEKLNRLEEQLYLRINKLRSENSFKYDSLKKTTDEVILNKLKTSLDENERQLSLLNEQLKIIQNNFIYSNPKSFVSLDLLLTFDKNEIISLDSLKSAYNKIDRTTQNSTIGNIIKQDIRKKENGRIGSIAPDFKAIDFLTNKPVSYSEFEGKNVVLLDFWASWCVPCRAAFPNLKNLYKKYHSKGFEVIAVSSFDFNKKALISAIEKDSIGNWHHVPVAERFSEGPTYITKDDIYDNYFVQAIPVQILIDKDGKIVGKWLGHSKVTEDELEKKLAVLFKEY
jgi:thiol-disulfide isomerase/thioredoxin